MVIRKRTVSRSKKLAQGEEVAKVAYQLFLDRGCVHGRDTEDWLEAEKVVLSKTKKKS